MYNTCDIGLIIDCTPTVGRIMSAKCDKDLKNLPVGYNTENSI